MLKMLRHTWDVCWFYIRRIVLKLQEDDIFTYSAAIAFNLLLCLIPLLLLLTSVLGLILSSSELAVHKIDDLLTAAFPDQPYAVKIKAMIQGVIYDIIHHRQSFGIVSAAILTWTGTFLFGAIRSALNHIFRLKQTKMFLILILENILAVVSLGILFLLANYFLWLSDVLKTLLTTVSGLEHFELGFLFRTVPVLVVGGITLLMFYILYQFMPNRPIPWKAALLASISTTVMWVFLAKTFEVYLVRFSSISTIYGTYAFLFVFLIWVEYSSITFIIGAIIGQIYRERAEARMAQRT
jgi:membrane protein